MCDTSALRSIYQPGFPVSEVPRKAWLLHLLPHPDCSTSPSIVVRNVVATNEDSSATGLPKAYRLPAPPGGMSGQRARPTRQSRAGKGKAHLLDGCYVVGHQDVSNASAIACTKVPGALHLERRHRKHETEGSARMSRRRVLRETEANVGLPRQHPRDGRARRAGKERTEGGINLHTLCQERGGEDQAISFREILLRCRWLLLAQKRQPLVCFISCCTLTCELHALD